MYRNWLLLILLAGVALTGVNCAPVADTPQAATAVANVLPDQPPQPRLVDLPPEFRDRLDAARKLIRQRNPMTTHGFWTVFHYILGVGPDSAFLFDVDTGKLVKAMDYICEGKRIKGLDFMAKPDGTVDVITNPGSGFGQGHQDQFVAEMVQWGLPAGKEFIVDGKKHTFADFVRHSKMHASVKRKQELSWAVMIIGEHFGTEHRWTNHFKEELSMEDVIRYEISEPIGPTTTCGGTHRLFDLTWVYHRHREKGGKKEGVWKDLVDYLDKYKKLARDYQHMDGTFSTKYVSEPDDNPDPDQRINTTGHVLEWLSLTLSDQELREPWMQEAADALIKLILKNPTRTFDGGTLYHAAHGLEIYRTRVFGPDVHPPVIPPRPKD